MSSLLFGADEASPFRKVKEGHRKPELPVGGLMLAGYSMCGRLQATNGPRCLANIVSYSFLSVQIWGKVVSPFAAEGIIREGWRPQGHFLGARLLRFSWGPRSRAACSQPGAQVGSAAALRSGLPAPGLQRPPRRRRAGREKSTEAIWSKYADLWVASLFPFWRGLPVK